MPAAAPTCADAVMVLPGIMGSELVEVETGRVLWGLADPGWYVRAWTTGGSLSALRPTPEELEGHGSRIAATRLLRFPAFAPILRGAEPYTKLVDALGRVAAHPAAVATFPYDWRLPVSVNARLLAEAAQMHLAAWRAHPACRADEVRLVLVAHSMGGLIARHFTDELGGGELVRTVVTLGTPFFGSVKVLSMWNSGRGGPVPLPHRRLRDLAASLPSVHDLLPTYRCVDEGGDRPARRLTRADVAAAGGDAELAGAALERRPERAPGLGPSTRMVVGVSQPTGQSVSLRDGVVTEHRHICQDTADGGVRRVDRGGDSTVLREAAALPGIEPVYFAQSHGGLPGADEVVEYVRAVLTEQPLGPPLGAVELGLDVPDVAVAGQPFPVTVHLSTDPAELGSSSATVRCRVVSGAANTPVARPLLRRSGAATLTGTVLVDRPGVYALEVKAGGGSAVRQLVLVVPASDTDDR
ncbi:esterase/lipase family protein [Actinospica robiniae]|uniref:esterase/lipase family protein n=1 Tax=Actinospica robiniae TaxID=304901 RepID=UPI0004108B66|nr:hypothetical protein [Actinospica robiniae]